jgi:ABC-type Fe3+ transport system substrate-binding protein
VRPIQILSAAALLLLSVRTAYADVDAALLAAARQEGQVVWYTGLIVNQIVRPMADAFAKKYPGIEVRYSRASDTETAVKILNEGRAHRIQADVFDATNAMFPLLDAKLVVAYPPKAAEHYPAEMKDPNGYWTATNLYFLTVAYNTDLVKLDEVPRSFADLLDPKWKGQMAWTSELAPQGPPGFIHNILTIMGEQQGMDYLRKFAAQEPVFIAASPRAVLDQVISGEHKMGVMMYNHHVAISAGKGAPIQWLKLEPLVGLQSLIGILKDAPHPNAARVLEEFILSTDGQKAMADNDYLPADPLVPARIAELKPDAGHFKANLMPPQMVHDDVTKWRAIFHDVFR